MRTPRPLLAAFSLFLALAPWARPQDAHYWTYQYGSRANLLGGAVIGSVLDLSGTYYNPGGMSLIDKPDTLMAANVFQLPRVSLDGAAYEGVPLNAQNPSPAPAIIAGTIRIRGLEKYWFGYSYLARQSVDLGVSVSSTGARDILPYVPGQERFASQYRLDEKVSERWFGLTWSYRLSKRVGLGVTQYLALRSHRAHLQETVETLDGPGNVALASGSRQFQYRHFRVLWKLGLACDLEGITLGLTVTTPSLSLGGTGSTGLSATVVDLDMDGDGQPDDYLAADYRAGQPTFYRSPFSLAGGLTVKIDKVRLYWSAEAYAGVRRYAVVDAPEFAAQSTGERLSTDVTQELRAVFNMGFGVEWLYSSRFKGYAGLTTDRSAKTPLMEASSALTDWNVLHLVTGAEFFIRSAALTVGLGYSFGDREIGERPDILDARDIPGMWDPFADMRFRYANYKLVFGFAF